MYQRKDIEPACVELDALQAHLPTCPSIATGVGSAPQLAGGKVVEPRLRCRAVSMHTCGFRYDLVSDVVRSTF